jgi:hypothetical protein
MIAWDGSTARGQATTTNTAFPNDEGGNVMLRPTLLAALLTAAIPIMALAQTADELKNDEKTPGDVLVYGMGYSGNRYSPLTQINKQNVSKLVPVWAYSLADLQGGESFPLVKDGVASLAPSSATAAFWKVMTPRLASISGGPTRSRPKVRPAPRPGKAIQRSLAAVAVG